MKLTALLLFFIWISHFLPGQSLMQDCSSREKARVVFFRPSGIANIPGSAFYYKLYVKDTLLTEIRSTSFYVAHLEPGNVRVDANRNGYRFSKNSKGFVELKLKPGGLYFVKCGVKKDPSGIKGLPRLSLLRGDEIKKHIRRCFLKTKLRKKLYSEIYMEALK